MHTSTTKFFIERNVCSCKKRIKVVPFAKCSSQSWGCCGHYWAVVICCLSAAGALGNQQVDGKPSSTPHGHLLPLGSHRNPEPPFTERYTLLLPEEFFDRYDRPRKPVVFRGVFLNHPALSRWQDDEYLRKYHGDAAVRIERQKKEIQDGPIKGSMLREFLETYRNSDDYLVSNMPEELEKEWFVPPMLICGGYLDHLIQAWLWFSSGGTSSLLRVDNSHNFHCVVDGFKQFILINSSYIDQIGMDRRDRSYFGMDVDRVDMLKYNMTGVSWWNVTVNTGDCLFIPYKWIHQVRSYNRNIGISLSLIPFKWFVYDSNEICDNNSIPLSEVEYHYEAVLRNMFTEAAGEEEVVTADNLARYLHDQVPRAAEYAEKVMNVIDREKKGWFYPPQMTELFYLEIRDQFDRMFVDHFWPPPPENSVNDPGGMENEVGGTDLEGSTTGSASGDVNQAPVYEDEMRAEL